MEKKVLIRLPDGSIRPFGERAAKIAIQLLGGQEITETDQPPKYGIANVPPQITKPIPLKETKPVEIMKPPEIKKDEKQEVKPVEIRPTELKKPPAINKAEKPEVVIAEKKVANAIKKVPARNKGRSKSTKK